MYSYSDSGTIAAISTPYGTGGLGIIRISGSDAFSIAEKIFIGKRPFKDIKSHTVSHGKIVIPETGETLDDVLIIKMKGPHTFTAEDTVEISCHGGIAVLKNVLSLVLRQGARAAEAGEFTKRAFLNGKMDLTQAEAVIDMINARTGESSRAAARQLEGKLSASIKSVRRKLIELIAHIEAVVDYPEHDIEEITGAQIYEGVKKAISEIESILCSYERGRLLREGITAAIIGRPNAGKSSLLNMLAGSDKAIVTDIPGTTRDIIEEYIDVKGIPVRFLDTAGIRNAQETVEAIGVERSRKAAGEAELVIIMIDAATGIMDDDIEILDSLENKKKIIIINKTDIAQDEKIAEIKKQLTGRYEAAVVTASMLEGTGLEELLDEIERLFLKGSIDLNNEVLITNARHKQLLELAAESLRNAMSAHEGGLPLDFVTIDIKESAGYLGQITGESVSEDVVREIFSRFCIGK